MAHYIKGRYMARMITYGVDSGTFAGKTSVGFFVFNSFFWGAKEHKMFECDELEQAKELYKEFKKRVRTEYNKE